PPRLTRPGNRQLGADDRAQTGGRRRFVKARQPVDAIAIDQRERRVAELRRAIDERLRQRRALQKTEGRRGVELDVHRLRRNEEWGIKNEEFVSAATEPRKTRRVQTNTLCAAFVVPGRFDGILNC